MTRIVRNLAFLLMVGAFVFSYQVGVRVTDWNCEGEDGFCQTQVYEGPVSCQSTGDCCAITWDYDKYETCDAFCSQGYGDVDWESSSTRYEGQPDQFGDCYNFQIFCACIPLPVPEPK
jgi:hypothetical protein